MGIFRYPGGKSRRSIQQLILRHAPQEYCSYREPFVGGGGMFFGIPFTKQRWINDMNTHLIAVYSALQNRPREFIELCQSVAPAQVDEAQEQAVKGGFFNRRLKDLFYSLRDDPTADPALRYFFLNRTGYAGRVVLDGDRINRTMFSNPAGWNIVATNKLVEAAEHLAGTTITCGDYEPLFTTPGDQVFIYGDPPYVRDTELPKSGKLYQHGFTLEDHSRLAQVVRRSEHNICLSYDDHPLIRELYRGFFIHEAAWTYCGTSLKKKTQGRELLITNYPVAKATECQPDCDDIFSTINDPDCDAPFSPCVAGGDDAPSTAE
jgi:DNA adenine methylase